MEPDELLTQLWTPPTASSTAVTPVFTVPTELGCSLSPIFVVLLYPSWPTDAFPQHLTPPEVVRPHVWYPPACTVLNVTPALMEATADGCSLSPMCVVF